LQGKHSEDHMELKMEIIDEEDMPDLDEEQKNGIF
jgi:hypothetical protein